MPRATDSEKHKIVWIRMDEIEPHQSVQRRFRPGWAKQLAAKMDPSKLGLIHVVPHPRKPGRYEAFDGQHRLAAAREVFGNDQKIECKVYTQITASDKARLADIALGLNNAKAWRLYDNFVQRVNRGDEDAVGIVDLLGEYNLRVSESGTKEGSVRSIAACVWTWKRGGRELLERVISILLETWGPGVDSFHGPFIKGLALFVKRHDGQFTDSRLVERMQKEGGSATFSGLVKTWSKTLVCDPNEAAYTLFVYAYNKRLSRERQLKSV